MARKKTIRRRRQTSGNKAKVLILLSVIFFMVGGGLFFLSQQPPALPVNMTAKKVKQDPPLPLPPEEKWSYIKALENRTVETVATTPSPSSSPTQTRRQEQGVWAVLDKPMPSSGTKNKTFFRLQCGAFDNPRVADERRARLLMLGLNVQVEKSGRYHRVFVDRFDSRAKAERALRQIQSEASCFIVASH